MVSEDQLHLRGPHRCKSPRGVMTHADTLSKGEKKAAHCFTSIQRWCRHRHGQRTIPSPRTNLPITDTDNTAIESTNEHPPMYKQRRIHFFQFQQCQYSTTIHTHIPPTTQSQTTEHFPLTRRIQRRVSGRVDRNTAKEFARRPKTLCLPLLRYHLHPHLRHLLLHYERRTAWITAPERVSFVLAEIWSVLSP